MTARDAALRKLARTIEELSYQSAAREAHERARRRRRVLGALGIGLAVGVVGTLGVVLASPDLGLIASSRDGAQERRAVAGEIGLNDLAAVDSVVVVTAAGGADDAAANETEVTVASGDTDDTGLRARFAREIGANAAEPVVLAQAAPENTLVQVSGGVKGQPQVDLAQVDLAQVDVAQVDLAQVDVADALPVGGAEVGVESVPWQENAQRFVAATPGQAMIAIVFDDLGVDQARSRRAISLPGPMTMAIMPYGQRLDEHAAAARAGGHELLVHIPMEPYDVDADAGPDPLLTSLSEDELRARVTRALDAFGGYVGVNNHMGSRFTEDREALTTVMDVLRGRGLLFLDSRTSQNSAAFSTAKENGVPAARRDVFLDHDPSREAVDAALSQLERVALEQGYAVGIAHPRDASLDALAAWLPQVQARGFTLVPISAVVKMELAGEAG